MKAANLTHYHWALVFDSVKKIIKLVVIASRLMMGH